MELEYNNLDDEWIHKFDEVDNLYKDFYKEDLYYVTLKIIYINRDNQMEKIKQQSYLMSKPNTILNEEIIEILKNNSIDNNKRYRLLSILKYNITLEPEEVNNYINYPGENDHYLSTIRYIDTITFEKSIHMFHDLNDLIIVFYERSNEIKTQDPHNTTKKIYLNSLRNNKKTIKKRYKD